MRSSLAIKTLFRTVGKTVFTFFLIAVLTFSLFLQLAEYRATAREFAENIEMYRGTGYLEKAEATFVGYDKLRYPYYIGTDPRVDLAGWDLPDLTVFDYPALTGAEIDEISAMAGVSSTHPRYMTAGRSAYPRLRDDDGIWDNNSLVVIEGTLGEPCMNVAFSPTRMIGEQAFTLLDAKLLAGDLDLEYYKELGPERWQYEYDSAVRVWSPEFLAFWDHEGSVKDGEIYFFPTPWSADDTSFMEEDWVPTASEDDHNMFETSRHLGFRVGNVILKNYPYGLDVQNTWRQGGRYVFVFRCSHEKTMIDLEALSLNLYDWLSEHFCPAVWDVTDAPENYLELPEYAPLKTLMEIIESDRNTLDVVYTGDMSAIRQIKDGKMALADGRWLSPEDTASGAMVCMLDQRFARTYGLQVGDTLPLELGDKLFEQFFNLGAIANTVERYADNWTDAEFEIVGLYSTSGGAFAAAKEPNWSYSVNTVFVPASALPETVDLTDHQFAPGEFTFRVDNAWDIAPFLEETAPRIGAMGMTLMFDDGGWMEVYTPYVAARRVALVRIALLAAVTALAIAFAVYLFISRKRKDYAIMRALGTPRRQSGEALLLPLMLLAAVSVILGLAAAIRYIERMGKLGRPPLGMALLCGIVALLLTLLLALAMLRGLGRQSPLDLLQGGTRPRAVAPQRADLAQAVAARPAEANPQAAARQTGILTQDSRRKPHSLRFVLRYIFRHIRRSAVKSQLAVLVAALMLSAVSQLGYMRGVYEQLRSDTVVTARFNMSIILPRLKELEADGLTADLYYERNLDGVIVLGHGDTREIHIGVTNHIESYVGGACEISYAPGYGPEDMSITGKYVVLGKAMMEENGIALGDTVRICKLEDTDRFFQTESRRLQAEYPGQYSDERSSLWEVWPEHMEQELDQLCDCLTVIGAVSTGDSSYDSVVFTPGLETTKKFMTDNLLEYVEFRVPDNSRAREMKQRGEDLTGHRSGAFSIDLGKLESVERTAALLETLYPVVIVLTLLIGAALCALLIMQTTKDAAIMRIQGTTKGKTRAMLAGEQIWLAVFGVGIGLGVMALIRRADFAAIARQALRFGGAYLAIAAAASMVSAVIATKKNLLELLQTKE